jgi:hypothetical protein
VRETLNPGKTMGRPQKNEQDKRTDPPIKIKMNDEERTIAKRESALAGLSMVAWARRKLFGTVPDQRKANPYRAKVIKLLDDIGHVMHRMKNASREADVQRLRELAEELTKELSDGNTR